ncbi:hypothetical protein L202_04709 [Cryptococcus amylolentus CBS 6039]|uniref:Uncharacterized protein n=1 Tax=Cryptococcus amylolentus CBS 6039 TaxID=1295533 RepID=A0A1E3HP98_9TREE|nr:hypothetical protein L202_04709 [Cryptococcus amylolentus CBS 6039]ODN77536.1 hypothetical protein L202_04709 [Cryptococcus amylolentus CBS 6039]
MGNSYSRARPPVSTTSSLPSQPSHAPVSNKGQPAHSSSKHAHVAQSDLPNLLERLEKDKHVRSMSVEINFAQNETPVQSSGKQRKADFKNRLAAAERKMRFPSSPLPREDSPTLRRFKASSASPPSDLVFMPDASSSPHTPTKSRSLRNLKTPWTPKSSADLEAERAMAHRLHQERRAEFIALMAEGQIKIDVERERLARDKRPLVSAKSMTTLSGQTDKPAFSLPRSLRTPRKPKHHNVDYQLDKVGKREKFMARLAQGQARIDAEHAGKVELLQDQQSPDSEIFAIVDDMKPSDDASMTAEEIVFQQRKKEFVALMAKGQTKARFLLGQIEAVRRAQMDSPTLPSFPVSSKNPMTPPASSYNHREPTSSSSSINTTSSWKSRGLKPLRLLQSRSSSAITRSFGSPSTPTPSVGDPDVSIPSSKKATTANGQLDDPFHRAPGHTQKPSKPSSEPAMRSTREKGEDVFDESFARFRSASGKNIKRLKLDADLNLESLSQAMASAAVSSSSYKENHDTKARDTAAADTSFEWMSDSTGVYYDAAQDVSLDKVPLTPPSLYPDVTTKEAYQTPVLSPEIATPDHSDTSRVSITNIIDDASIGPEHEDANLVETVANPFRIPDKVMFDYDKTFPRQIPVLAESPAKSDLSTSSEEVSQYVPQDHSLMSFESEYSQATATADTFHELDNLDPVRSDTSLDFSFPGDDSGPINLRRESLKASSDVEMLSGRDETFESLPSLWSQPSLVIRASEESVRHVVEPVVEPVDCMPTAQNGPQKVSKGSKRASVVISSPNGSIPGITISDMSDDNDDDSIIDPTTPPHRSLKSKRAPAPKRMRENDPSSIAYPKSLRRAPTKDKTGRGPLAPLSPNLSRMSRNTQSLGKYNPTQPTVQDKEQEQNPKEGKRTLKGFALKKMSMMRMRSGNGEQRSVGQGLRMF